jgi:hypothetical protein
LLVYFGPHMWKNVNFHTRFLYIDINNKQKYSECKQDYNYSYYLFLYHQSLVGFWQKYMWVFELPQKSEGISLLKGLNRVLIIIVSVKIITELLKGLNRVLIIIVSVKIITELLKGLNRVLIIYYIR